MGQGYSGGIENVESEKSLPTYKQRGRPNTRYDYYQNGKLKLAVLLMQTEFL